MNLSNVITRIKLKLGLINITTPFTDIDNVILTILNEITTPVFSIYYPCKESLTLRTLDLELLSRDNTSEKYLLPDFKTRELLYVFDVRYDTTSLCALGYYTGSMPLMGGNYLNQLMVANAGANVMNQVIPKMTFKFERPRTLTLYNAYSSNNIVLDLGFSQDKSLTSIPETCREDYMKLAMLDVKDNLYPTLKQYTELNTAIGNINLKLDDWANAESERKELIEKWDDTYHLDFHPIYWA